MKRVLMINGSGSPIRCGVGLYGEQLYARLQTQTELSLLTSAETTSNPDIPTTTTPDWRLHRLIRLVKAVRRNKPDIVHVQYPAIGYKRGLGINLLPFALRFFYRKAPVVVMLHEYHESPRKGRVRNLLTIFAARYTFVSNTADQQALPGWLQKKTQIIPIGSNIPKMKPNKKTYTDVLKTAGFDSKKPTIAYFGFTNPNKGVDVLVSATPQLNAQVLLLTELRTDNAYQHYVQKLVTAAKEQGGQIHVAGYLPNQSLSEVLQECTLFAIPQPLPLTAKSGTTIAAADHGLPIVSTKAADARINEPYQDGVNALLLEQPTPESLAQTCNELLADTQKLAVMKRATAQLGDYFSWQDIAKKHVDFYESLG